MPCLFHLNLKSELIWIFRLLNPVKLSVFGSVYKECLNRAFRKNSIWQLASALFFSDFFKAFLTRIYFICFRIFCDITYCLYKLDLTCIVISKMMNASRKWQVKKPTFWTFFCSNKTFLFTKNSLFCHFIYFIFSLIKLYAFLNTTVFSQRNILPLIVTNVKFCLRNQLKPWVRAKVSKQVEFVTDRFLKFVY